jgi:hypothetical protein
VLAAVILLATLVAGCIPVPVPTPDAKPRYSAAQLDVVGREASTAGSVRAELGPPDLKRDNGRIWIYTWHKVSGMFIDVPLWSDDPATPGGTIVSKQFLLVLEFDADGRLQGKQLIQQPPQNGRGPYCTSDGLCVAGEVLAYDETFGYDYVFEDASSTVTVRGEALERVTPLEPEPDECLLTLWPSVEWKKLAIYGPGGDKPPAALALAVEGANPWWSGRSVPLGTYAHMVVPAGRRLVSVRDPRSESRSAGAAASDGSAEEPAGTAAFRCSAGDHVYLAIGPTLQAGKGFPGARRDGAAGFPIVLRRLDMAAAQSMITNMARVLPPE